ncbi:MAG: hypothetical protein PVG39_26140 [Desulfobacteraceae bacterium]
MSDLTLYEFSGLKEEEIKTRLREEYNYICHTNIPPDDKVISETVSQRNMKLVWRNIRTHITVQLKSIFLKRKPFLP